MGLGYPSPGQEPTPQMVAIMGFSLSAESSQMGTLVPMVGRSQSSQGDFGHPLGVCPQSPLGNSYWDFGDSGDFVPFVP